MDNILGNLWAQATHSHSGHFENRETLGTNFQLEYIFVSVDFLFTNQNIKRLLVYCRYPESEV